MLLARCSPRFSPSTAVCQFAMPIHTSFPSSGWEGRANDRQKQRCWRRSRRRLSTRRTSVEARTPAAGCLHVGGGVRAPATEHFSKGKDCCVAAPRSQGHLHFLRHHAGPCFFPVCRARAAEEAPHTLCRMAVATVVGHGQPTGKKLNQGPGDYEVHATGGPFRSSSFSPSPPRF
nr:uncharacterized protein LOC127341059 isoform X1 [Lolium perenne]